MKKCLHVNDAKRKLKRIHKPPSERRPVQTIPLKMLWPTMSRRERVAANLAAAGVPLSMILRSARMAFSMDSTGQRI